MSEQLANVSKQSNDIKNDDSTSEKDVNKNVVVDETIAPFPIVGIGASAGGLEAIQSFFDNLTPEPNVAFVIVQHLSPDYKSFMDELLGRHTSIPIKIVTDKTKVEINHIYLIPPKMNMTIRRGTLYLTEITGHALNLPIDIFLRSLAEDQKSNAIAIILSGTGSDGTLGIRAIKELGGVTMSQDDRSAKFDGMPLSSIATGMVDIVQPPGELAKELINYIKHPIVTHTSPVEYQLLQNQSLYKKIMSILHDAKNINFSTYKQNTIVRRLEKRISINRFVKVADYVSYLSSTPKEINALFNDILIGVTKFFRDEKAFETFSDVVLPMVLNKKTEKSEIRIWCPGCSTGEEAYTIAILIKDFMIRNDIINDVKIFATDIDEDSLNFAGNGFYPNNISADVPQKYLERYFTPHSNGYQINDNIRRMIIFARHNVIDEPPFSKLDIISCRNLLIYFDNETQIKVLSTFHTCLKPDAVLFLGSSESLGVISDGFDVIDSHNKFFKKRSCYKPVFAPTASIQAPLHCNRSGMLMTQQSVNMLRQGSRQLSLVFEEVANSLLPPSVIIDANGNIIYSIQNAGNLLTLPPGQFTTNILKLLPRDLSVSVSGLIRRAEKKPNQILSIEIKTSTDKQLCITCKLITSNNTDLVCYYLSFEEKTQQETSTQKKHEVFGDNDLAHQYQDRIDELEREIQQKNESLQATVEELETSNEELQSSNEELIASNEELQSTNEELQSVNEELYTVNAEHIRKIEEMTEMTSDFDNLLNITQIGTLYLDKNLVIRKISTITSNITNILPADIGRSLKHLSLSNLYADFMKDVEKVNVSHRVIERKIQYGDKTYLMRIVPYKISEKVTMGIIITFVEVSSLK